MTSPRSLSNSELVAKIKSLKANEDRLLVELLEHIQVFEQRKLHLKLGFPSLYAYLTKVLGYAESEAYRRIEASRFMKVDPEIKNLIDCGKLSLSAVTEARIAIRAQEKSMQTRFSSSRQLEVAKALVDCSKKEAQVKLAQIFPDHKPTNYERRQELLDGGMQITFRVNPHQRRKIDRTKIVYSRNVPVSSTAGLFEGLCDFYLSKKDHEKNSTQGFVSRDEASRYRSDSITNRYIPQSLRREVFSRDKGVCQFPKPEGGICGAEFEIEVDHIIPVSKGGKSVLENLRCLCRPHNNYKSDG